MDTQIPEPETIDTQKPVLTLTDKEELAVIVQRLNTHKEKATNEKVKVRLDIASDLVRSAIAWMGGT